jgi:hypothetical protein
VLLLFNNAKLPRGNRQTKVPNTERPSMLAPFIYDSTSMLERLHHGVKGLEGARLMQLTERVGQIEQVINGNNAYDNKWI